MSNLKLTDYEAAGSTFTFPYNPNSVDITVNKFIANRAIPYSFAFIGMASPIVSSMNIGLNGHFSGTNKNSNYRSLVSKVNNPIMLKLYFENSYAKFYLCTGTNVQKVPNGTRPTMVDYVANFFSPFGMLFSDTQKNGAHGDNDENAGDIDTPIEKITGEVVSGNLVTIKDKNDNGFKFTPTASGTMTYYLVKMTSQDNKVYIPEFMYVDVEGTVQIITNADSGGDLMLRLAPGESLNDIFTGGAVTGITSDLFYLRDGWTSD